MRPGLLQITDYHKHETFPLVKYRLFDDVCIMGR